MTAKEMTTQEKINYINYVYTRFNDSRNHGGRNSWWYPDPFVVAYDVKMRSFPDMDKLRARMSKIQWEYYRKMHDSELYEICYIPVVEQEIEDANEEIKRLGAYDTRTAGRSGGWLEVVYDPATLVEIEDPHTYSSEDIEEIYKDAKVLESIESSVAAFIRESHKRFNEYIDSEQHYIDMVADLYEDSDILEIYKDKIEELKVLIRR